MSLDLGALVAGVFMETAEFDRAYPRVIRQMAQLGADAAKAAGGTVALDDGLVGVGNAAERASVKLDTATRATGSNATAEERAAAAAARHAEAMATVAATMEEVAATTPKVQAATLRVVAAQERLNSVQASGTATTRQLASAQATLISANRSLATAEEQAAVAGKHWYASMGGVLKTAAELGLIIGGIEIARKVFEFVAAGKELTDSLNSVQAAAQATDAQMVPVRATVLALGRDLTVPKATAIDAAEAIDDLVRSGMTLPRAMAAARSALLLVSVTNTDAALSARVLGDALDEFQLPASQATHVATMLAAAATSTSGGLTTVFEALQYAGTRARAADIPMADLLATIVDLSKAGLQGSTIGTGLAMAISKLARPSSAGSKALNDLGIAAWDAQGRFKGLPYIVDQVFQAKKRFGADGQRFLADVTVVFGARAGNAIAAFAGKGIEGLDRFENRLKNFDLQKAADEMNRGVGAGFRQLGKEATATGIDIYQKLEPQLNSAVQWIGVVLPKAIHTLQADLSPLAHFLAGAFATGWHLAAGAIKIAAAVLVPVLHVVEDLKTPLGAIAVLAAGAWLGFQGFRAAGLLLENVIQIVKAIPGALAAMVAKTRTAASEYVASWTAMSTSAKTGAAVSTAAMTDIELEAAAMSGTVVAEGEAASVGWAGLLGPIGAVAVGVGLLVTMFHHSSSASKQAAADATTAYTDALKASSGVSLRDTIIDQLNKANVPSIIDDYNMLANASKKVKATDFVAAIEERGKALDGLRAKLNATITSNQKLINSRGKDQGQGSGPAIANAADEYEIDKARKLLAALNTEVSGLDAATKKDLADTKAFFGQSASIADVGAQYGLATKTADQYAAMVGVVGDKNDVVSQSSIDVAAAITTVQKAYAGATQTGDAFLSALSDFAQSAGTAADRAALIGAALKAANGDSLSFVANQANAAAAAEALGQAFSDEATQLSQESTAQKDAAAAVVAAQKRVNEIRADAHHKASTLASAENSLAKAQQNAAKEGALSAADTERAALSFDKAGRASINYTKKGAPALIQQLQAIQDAAMQLAEAQYQHEGATKKAADDAYNTYVAKTQGALVDEADKLGISKAEAIALGKAYFGMPSAVKTSIESIGTDKVVDVLNKIGHLLAAFTGQPWDVNTKPAVQKVDDLNTKMDKLAAQRATPYVSIDDQASATLDKLLKKMGALRGAQIVAKAGDIGDLHGQAYATGGQVNGPGTATSDSIRARLSRGEIVENAAASSKFGDLLLAINSGQYASMNDLAEHFTGGARTTGRGAPGGPHTVKHQTVNLTVHNPVEETTEESFALNMNRAENVLD